MKKKEITMNDMYKDNSNHIACQDCGFCITCKECICNINEGVNKKTK